MTETCHLEALRKQRALDRYHESIRQQSSRNILTNTKKVTQKVSVCISGRGKLLTDLPCIKAPPSAAEAVGQITRLVTADSYHRAFTSDTLAKMNRRYTVSCSNCRGCNNMFRTECTVDRLSGSSIASVT